MTSRLYSILLLLMCTITAQAQEYHVETPGTLQEVIGPGAEELTRIRVTGTLITTETSHSFTTCVGPLLQSPQT